MAELLKKERDFVLPGDELVKSMDYLPGKNAYREGDSVYAKRLGIVSLSNRVVSVIPLNSGYMPKAGDMVIGTVEEIQSNGWIVDIKAPYSAYLPLSGVREFIDTSKIALSTVYDIGDLLYAKVNMANSGSVHLSMQDPRSRKFRGGRIVKINPAKVPRLIGKMGSMITLIKDRTGCRISVGQNGLVWVDGERDDVAAQAVDMIERDSFHEGLTDRVAALVGGGPVPKQGDNYDKTQTKG
ncbi:MAG: exosome complex protein Rrp4 [Nanoarchaeota archaeon]|nr:exosome complex protein Rrp4 [Nanoarchaeota archaeon]